MLAMTWFKLFDMLAATFGVGCLVGISLAVLVQV